MDGWQKEPNQVDRQRKVMRDNGHDLERVLVQKKLWYRVKDGYQMDEIKYRSREYKG